MNKKIQLIVTLFVILGMTFIPSGDVLAQEGPLQVFFTPDPAYLYTSPSNSVVVKVDVTDAVDLWSFDIAFEYDETVVTLQSFTFVDVFGGIQCPWQVNNPGFFGLGCTSWGGDPFNGDTTLAELTFVGVSIGQTPMSFTSFTSFGNTQQQYIPHVSDDGLLFVVDPSTFLFLPLIMNVSVQGVLERDGIEVTLGPGLNYGMSYSGTTSNTEGNNLSFANVAVDTYRITTDHARVLNVTPALNKTYTLAPGADPVPLLRLAAGNAVWTDNIIDVHDWTAVNGAWGDASLNVDADVNFDNFVDARDLALVAGNFGLTSAVAYAGWLP